MSGRKNKFLIVSGFFLVHLLFEPHGLAKNLEKVSMKLNWKFETQFLGFLVAKEKGFYQAEGLDVSIFESESVLEAAEIPGKVVAGKYQFAIGSGSLTTAHNQGLPLVVLAATFQFSPSVIFALEESGIRSITDIKGHSIVIKGKLWNDLLDGFLKTVGVQLSDLEKIPGGFDMTPFFEKRVDIWTGYLNNEVTRARLKGYKLVTFPIYEYGFDHLGAGIYTSRRYQTNNQALIQKFVNASIKGWEQAIANPGEAIELFLDKFPEKRVNRKFHVASFNATIPLVRPPGAQIGSIDCRRYLKKIKTRYRNSESICTEAYIQNIKKTD